ncbi:IS200/IS605 family accessory protein TnpB-related protein [Carboxydothermus ferrireducens]|uniref:IS605 OrfB family transposase n=1 Tax=Carboxydothermus ferrireducens DSM 11255 TaxID=1119529 RepID=A0ABX2RB56_9THEO|nr:IS200/IS605 family accessory protein TnpB-related protein [Carboxydothermus ferrireducens]NYE57313.1 IS605 OrfB family transposase [Carboxydothermus ferrireducens DSM 11255]
MKQVITIQARLFPKAEENEVVDNLMRKWNSCKRYAYNRLLEGKARKELKKELQSLFGLNSRYVDDAILEANEILQSIRELGENPRKVIFGGKVLFSKLKRKHLSAKQRQKYKKEWEDKRKGTLFSRGDRSKQGNLNLRVIEENGQFFLRVNAGNRKWLFIELKSSHKKWGKFAEAMLNSCPYSVRLQRKNNKYYAYISFEDDLPNTSIDFSNGAIGIDLNAFPSHIAWAEIKKNGNLESFGEIPTPHLWDGRKEKRDYFAWVYAHEIVKLALKKKKGIVIEKVAIKDKGFRGDCKGRKSRRIKHTFSYRKLISRIKTLAQRYGVAIREVSPVYTSVIGMLKYAPQFNLTKDTAAAYVIARRGLALREKIPLKYREHLKSLQSKSRSVSSLTEGRNEGTVVKGKTLPYKPWRVLRVALLTGALLDRPLYRDLSPLKRILVSGMGEGG